IIHLKTGETVTKLSTMPKQELYHDNANVAGFKIDLRTVTNINEDETDFAVCEVAKDQNKAKLYHNISKLVREAKNVLHYLYVLTGRKRMTL
ncbi:hypothetical protein BCV72DRAFT_212686, partial [Rhizopus microsporus var. microsporus]